MPHFRVFSEQPREFGPQKLGEFFGLHRTLPRNWHDVFFAGVEEKIPDGPSTPVRSNLKS
jgi:hypothetical protein